MVSKTLGQLVVTSALVLFSGCASDPVEPPSRSPSQIPAEGLLAFYPFSGNARDQSGHGNDGTTQGGATVDKVLVIGDNVADALSLPNTLMNGLGDFTVSAWCKIGTLHKEHTLISGEVGTSDNLLFLYRLSDKTWHFGAAGQWQPLAQNNSIEDLKWHHVAVMRSGSLARFYIDGTEIGDGKSYNANPLNIASNGLIVGQEQAGVGGPFEASESFSGMIDNLRIYNRSLTSEEIVKLSKETGWGD